jgi:hypothetical protein
MTTAKSPEGNTPQAKRTRVATVSYPYHSLESCIELARAVREIGNGRTEVTKSQLAHKIGVSEKSGDFSQKIASTKTYGMIDGKSSLRLTEAGNRFFIPTDENAETKKLCLFRFLESPGAFRALIDTYDGSIPLSNAVIANILGQKYGIPESWKSRVAVFFIKSAQYVGAIGADRFLRFKAQIDGIAPSADPIVATDEQEIQAKPQSSPPTARPVKHEQNQEGVIVWTYPCAGKFLRIETPENMTQEVWEKLNKYIQVLQP